jgi:hypothetical protein
VAPNIHIYNCLIKLKQCRLGDEVVHKKACFKKKKKSFKIEPKMQSGILHAVSIKKPPSHVCGYGRIQQSVNANHACDY